jgi:hypothetical protein
MEPVKGTETRRYKTAPTLSYEMIDMPPAIWIVKMSLGELEEWQNDVVLQAYELPEKFTDELSDDKIEQIRDCVSQQDVCWEPPFANAVLQHHDGSSVLLPSCMDPVGQLRDRD